MTTLKPQGEISGLTFSADGRYLVNFNYDGKPPGLWEVESGEALSLPHKTEEINGYCGFSDDSRWLLATKADQTAGIWDLATRELLFTLPRHAVRCAASREP